MTDRLGVFPPGMDGRRQTMRTPDEVAAMHRLDSVRDLECAPAGGQF
jgi:hypothetical protein